MPGQRICLWSLRAQSRGGNASSAATFLLPVSHRGLLLLAALANRPGEVLTKSELMDAAWPGTAVEESNLSVQIASLRKLLGSAPDGAEWIATVPRVGYRFTGQVEKVERTDAHAKTKPSLSPPDKPSIAVLPFQNMSADTEQEYFSDGIAEDIITALSRLRWFLVIARNSSFAYKGKAVDVKQVGRELGVRYVLEGSVRKAGTRVRITAQLVDALSGTHYWAETYDRELTDIFAVQDDITQSVSAAIEPRLVAAEAMRAQKRHSGDVDAWDVLMRALSHYWRMTNEESEIALEMLEKAVAEHPNYGPAHSILAFALLVSGHVGWKPEGHDYARAARLAYRAAELDDEDPWAHLALAYYAFTQRDTAESVRQYRQALDINPNFATAYGYLGWALVFDGQSEDAILHFQRALRMSPHDPLKAFFHSGTGVAHYYAHRYEEAIDWIRSAIRLRPGFTAAHRILCASLAQAGKADEAQAATDETARAAAQHLNRLDRAARSLHATGHAALHRRHAQGGARMSNRTGSRRGPLWVMSDISERRWQVCFAPEWTSRSHTSSILKVRRGNDLSLRFIVLYAFLGRALSTCAASAPRMQQSRLGGRGESCYLCAFCAKAVEEICKRSNSLEKLLALPWGEGVAEGDG